MNQDKKIVLITGTSNGIGLSTARLFLEKDYVVVGLDKEESKIIDENYFHYQVDVSKKNELPSLDFKISYVVNNAGTVSEKDAIDTNLFGYLNIINKYCRNNQYLESLINIASISAHAGIEGLNHSASQGARLSITKNLAIELGKKYKTRVNSISPGAVLTNLEPKLYQNQKLIDAVKNENILKRWIEPEEIANWIYFISVQDRSLTGQDILIDCGESSNYNFISYE